MNPPEILLWLLFTPIIGLAWAVFVICGLVMWSMWKDIKRK